MYILCLKASHAMGMGHLFRMLNLHQALQRKDMRSMFVLVDSDPSASQWLAERGIPHELVDSTLSGWECMIADKHRPHCWINDRLNTDATHAKKINALGIELVTFDDMGTGASYADINVAALAEARGETPEGRIVLEGMDYLILSPEINHFRYQRHSGERLIVNLGGSDTYGMTIMVLEYLMASSRAATVILGPGFMYEDALSEVTNHKIIIKRSVPSLMAEFFQHDIAITGGGITAFEAVASGLPTLTIANELHEIGHCEYLEKMGCSHYAGYRNTADINLLGKLKNISEMSLHGMNKIGLDAADKIINKLSKFRERF